ISNEIGMDMRAKYFNVSSINTTKNKTVQLESNLLKNINLTRAYYDANNNPPIKPISIKKSITTANSNLGDFLSNFPNQLGYNAQIEVNPLGNISGGNDFIYRGTGIDLGVEINIPLNIEATNLILIDTADYIFLQENFYNNINDG